ncbi:MAG: DNA internalization-related competence protein ComEC/Rec2 [Calditrichaeota bacterium]|nr:DNA internalization-related competence protein ComEC/Rec2 [Calditrichota bacterium]
MIKHFHTIPVLFFFVLFSAGITASWYLGQYIDEKILLLSIAVLFLSLIFLYKTQLSFFYVSLALVFVTGFLRMWVALFMFTPAESSLFEKNITQVQGTIIDTRYREDKADLYLLKVDTVFTNDSVFAADGLMAVHQGKYNGKFEFGDYIRIPQKPEVTALPGNPGEFNYRFYFQLKDQFFTIKIEKNTKIEFIAEEKGNYFQYHIFNPVRTKIRKIIDTYLPAESAGIVSALILGDRSSLNQSIVNDFQKTGVVHVLAISGLHVGFIALFVQFLLSFVRIPGKITIILTIAFLLFFVALVDFKAPVVRASAMMIIYYLTKFIRRPQDPLNVLAIAGVLILAVQPEQLLLPGFQYSFSAVFGLLYGGERLNRLIPSFHANSRFKKFFNIYLRTAFIASFCAVLATLPLTWYYYGVIQIGALIANVIVIPAIGVILFLSVFFILISFFKILPVLGVAMVLDFIIQKLTLFIGLFARVPFIQLSAGMPNFFELLLVSIIIFFLFTINKAKSRQIILITVLFLTTYTFIIHPDQNRLRLTFINVGQGDACLIEFPNGKSALVDGGDKNFSFDAGERYLQPVLKNLGITKINYLIGTHPHSDHIGGFEYILQNFAVDTLALNGLEASSGLFKRIINLAQNKDVFKKIVRKGQVLIPDPTIRLYVLHPDGPDTEEETDSGKEINNSSIMLKLVYGNTSVLLNGDAETEAENQILKYGSFLDCDIMKVGHHGSVTSSSEMFLDLARPEIAIVSVGHKNKFKHPGLKTLQKFASRNIKLLRTDLSGALVFESDGEKIKRVDWR